MNTYTPGTLVRARNREWVVQPSDDENLLVIKPLDGSDEETTAIYLPLQFPEDKVEDAQFCLPGKEDLGDITTSKQLYNAARLSFRNGSGPFRSLAKLSFRPRSYQMVPLIMALRQDPEPVRMLIADDVGIGKTVESLLVVKELLERRTIKRFAIVCLPHLCDQWQQEIKEKFDIDAVIIRSNTQARLDREIQGDTSVYEYYPYQIISIDYIKTEQRRRVFVNECPEMVIVDEAHTCAKPEGAHKGQQHRYRLLRDIADKEEQHLVLLTATPHSGKTGEFQSLLGLLKNDFENWDLHESSQKQRQSIARHFVQRKRVDVERWMNEDTLFPERDAGELDYSLSKEYLTFYDDILNFARDLISGDKQQNKKRVHYWTALALLRGVMSSPAAGIEMLQNRLDKIEFSGDDLLDEDNPVLDGDFTDFDSTPTHVIEKNSWSEAQARRLKQFATRLESLKGLKLDQKAFGASMIVEDWVNDKFNPVIFCRYINTAKYLGEVLKPALQKKFKNIDIQVVTSEDPDEVRKERIDAMGSSQKRLLICTDCLSEGINLQEHFTAVLHYDLPWNPNRLEQREGRVDRFGQTAEKVKTYLLYGKDNPIDGIVLDVLLRKVREIKKRLGISVAFPENSQTILDTVLQSVFLSEKKVNEMRQMEFDFMNEERAKQEMKASHAIEEAAQREKQSRSIFAQNAIKADEIEEDLKETDEALGNPKAVEEFVITSVTDIIGAQIEKDRKGYTFYTTNLPPQLKNTLPAHKNDKLKISFESPTPDGYMYIGRNQLFTEQLCQFILANSINHSNMRAARAAVIKSSSVKTKTTIVLFRCRNVIKEKLGKHEIVAEEMILWGYHGIPGQEEFLTHEQAKEIIDSVKVTGDLPLESRWFDFLKPEMKYLDSKFKADFDLVAEQRSEKLVEAHERFSKAVGGSRFQIVSPVLPMDKMGIYIIVPDLGGQ